MKALKNYISKHTFLYLIRLALLSLGINVIVEMFNRSSFIGAFVHIGTNLPVFLYNSFLIFVTLMITLLFRRRIFALFIICTIWIVLGVVNAILLVFRITPFSAVDIIMFKDALTLIPVYFKFIHFLLVGIGIICVVFAAIFTFKKSPKEAGKIHYFTNSILIVISIAFAVLITNIGVATKLLARNFGNLADAYKDYGFVYCFVNSALNTGISKPDNYSEELVDSIIAETEDPDIIPDLDVIPEKENTHPNIIFLQLESFFDPRYMKNFVFSDNPIKNFTKLREKYPSGFLSVPSIGAGTANTEFEIITGMCLDFFGPGEYPYKTILKNSTCESYPYLLKELGYKTHAMHNNDGTFYNRNTVFPNLGFDSFIPLEYMKQIEYNPTGWPKDKILTSEIMKVLSSTPEPDYLYTISVQGHGKYPNDLESYLPYMVVSGFSEEFNMANEVLDSINKDALDLFYHSDTFITIDGIDEERKYAFEYYINQLKEMDEFVGSLIKELSAIDEDTILVLYGDHLPSLNIKEEELLNSDLYQTEYIIWSNFELDCEDRDLESFQLGAYVMQQIGIDNGLLDKIHQVNNYQFDQYQDKLEVLQYDMLYGDKAAYDFETPYAPVDMKMGIEEISITDVTRDGNTLNIIGQNFNQFSCVYVKNKDMETTFHSDTLLSIELKPENGILSISVSQRGDDRIILGTSNIYEYADSKHIPKEKAQ